MAFQIGGRYLNVVKARASRINLFGLEISNERKSAFSGAFSWAA